ncbi:MAG: SxtJ family membrane protein [Bacteroidota bacterium]
MNNQQNENSKHEIPLSIVLFMLILYFISKNSIFIIIGFSIGLLSLLSDTITYYISWAWKQLLRGVGFINAHVLLGLVFFVILFPISLLYRLSNRDSLNLKSGKKSYFEERDHIYVAKDIENPW